MAFDPTQLLHLGLEIAQASPHHKTHTPHQLAHLIILARVLLADLVLPEELGGILPSLYRELCGVPNHHVAFEALDEAISAAQIALDCKGTDVAEPLHTLLRFGLADEEGEDGHTRRRAHGVFYTPATVAAWLVGQAIQQTNIASTPLRVGDLCCGCGTFLVAAADWLMEQEASPHGIVGCDIDPIAVEVARLRLYRRLMGKGVSDEVLASRLMQDIAVSDGLVFDFKGLDVAVSNPPFGSAISLDTSRGRDEHAHLKRVAPTVACGAYDLSFVFAARMLQIVREGGSYGVILPRSVLSVASGRGVRHLFEASAPPRVVWAPPTPRLFAGADVFVALLAGRRTPQSGDWTAHVSTALPVGKSGSPHGALEEVNASPGETWSTWLLPERELERAVVQSDVPMRPLAEMAVLHGGAATGAAYQLKPLVEEADDTPPFGLSLVTTGLIDRYTCLWGHKQCRYLKGRYDRPVWPDDRQETLTVQVRRASVRQRTAKVLVGGLSKVIEAVADPEGRLGGVVSTWVVRPHDDDDPRMLWMLEAVLNSPVLSMLYMIRFRGKELSSGNTTIGQRELGSLPVPSDLVALVSASKAVTVPTHTGWRWVFGANVERATLASLVVERVARSGSTPEETLTPEADALVSAAISRLYGVDEDVHTAIAAWHALRMK